MKNLLFFASLFLLANTLKGQTANQELFDLLLSNGTITPQEHAILTGTDENIPEASAPTNNVAIKPSASDIQFNNNQSNELTNQNNELTNQNNELISRNIQLENINNELSNDNEELLEQVAELQQAISDLEASTLSQQNEINRLTNELESIIQEQENQELLAEQARIELENATPIFSVQPDFPRRAVVAGITGYAIVEFVVTTDGSVINAEIVESDPGNVFDSSSLDAIAEFQFNPTSEPYTRQFVFRYGLEATASNTGTFRERAGSISDRAADRRNE